jgi:thioredoxin reductase (NADPH)
VGGGPAGLTTALYTAREAIDTLVIERAAVDGAFIFIGLVPNTHFLADSGIELDEWGFVVTGHDLVHDAPLAHFDGREPAVLETSVPSIFAAGDVRVGSTKQVASAAGEGATAALLVREYLKTV